MGEAPVRGTLMKIQLAAITSALAILAMTIPSVRSTVFAAVPSIEKNDECGNIVCSDEHPRSGEAPDMKLRR